MIDGSCKTGFCGLIGQYYILQTSAFEQHYTRTISGLDSDHTHTIFGLNTGYIPISYTLDYNLSILISVSSTKHFHLASNNTYLYISSEFILHIIYISYELLSLVKPETFRSRTAPTS